MTEILLCQAICELIREAIKEMAVPDPDGDVSTPAVYNGFVPFRKEGKDGFPFVVVRPNSSTTDENSVSVEVGISVGAFYELKDDGSAVDGYEDSLNVVSRIRRALFDLPAGCLDGQYILDLPIRVQVSDDQAYPYWQVDMTTKWTFRKPDITNWSEDD